MITLENNGWIINDKNPEDYGAYHVKYKNGQTLAWFNGVDFITLVGKKFNDGVITHWQSIIKPEEPLY